MFQNDLNSPWHFDNRMSYAQGGHNVSVFQKQMKASREILDCQFHVSRLNNLSYECVIPWNQIKRHEINEIDCTCH